MGDCTSAGLADSDVVDGWPNMKNDPDDNKLRFAEVLYLIAIAVMFLSVLWRVEQAFR